MANIYYHGIEIDLDDPGLLLAIITTLQEMGYRVEPPTQYQYVGAAPGASLVETVE